MDTRTTRCRLHALPFWTAVLATAACGGSTLREESHDAGNGMPDTSVANSGDHDADNTSSGRDGDVNSNARNPDDAGDAGVVPLNCRDLHAREPLLPDGVYTIDVDGPGGIPPLSLYCDMSFNQGGWTLVQAYTGTNDPQDLLGADGGGVDGGIGFLVAPPVPGTFGALTGQVVTALATNSTQVHVRMSFSSGAGANEATWITSRAPSSATDVPLPMQALRDLHVVTRGSAGGYTDFFGPSATSTELVWDPAYQANGTTCQALVDSAMYPSIIWPCGNANGLTIITLQPNAGSGGSHSTVTFDWNAPVEQPIEVYVR
jgi:hypothetical protein